MPQSYTSFRNRKYTHRIPETHQFDFTTSDARFFGSSHFFGNDDDDSDDGNDDHDTDMVQQLLQECEPMSRDENGMIPVKHKIKKQAECSIITYAVDGWWVEMPKRVEAEL